MRRSMRVRGTSGRLTAPISEGTAEDGKPGWKVPERMKHLAQRLRNFWLGLAIAHLDCVGFDASYPGVGKMSASHRRRSWLGAAAATIALMSASCSGSGGPQVELTEFSVSVDPASADSGETTFSVKNVGSVTHEFVVVKTDLDEADLPTSEDGSVDEGGEGIEPIDEIEDIEADGSGELSVDLDEGSYVLFCNVVDGGVAHYQKGMHTSFTVE